MSYKRREPVSEKTMLNTRYKNHHTICETLREIYISTEDEEIKYKCRLAMAMAKAMQNQLQKYKAEKENDR
jgi:hypothetical protein